MTFVPFRSDTSIGTISSLNVPASIAASAFCWLPAANSSCASREMPYCSARFSAVMPMWMSLNASIRPSWTIESIIWAGPMRAPKRPVGTR